MSLGFVEILLVALVFLVLGPRRIADLFRSLGRGIHDFVGSLGRDGEQKEIEDGNNDEDRPPR